MDSAKQKSDTASILGAVVILILAAQGVGYAVELIRNLMSASARAQWTEANTAYISLGVLFVGGTIAGAWLHARHEAFAGLAFISAVAFAAVNGALNYYVGRDLHMASALSMIDGQGLKALAIGVSFAVVAIPIWIAMLIGGGVEGAMHHKTA